MVAGSKYEKSKALVAENRQSSDLVSAELDHALSQVSREQQRYEAWSQVSVIAPVANFSGLQCFSLFDCCGTSTNVNTGLS